MTGNMRTVMVMAMLMVLMVLVMIPVAFPQQRDLRFRCGGSGVRSSEGSGNQGVVRDSRP